MTRLITRRHPAALARRAVAGLALLLAGGCALLTPPPDPVGLDDRLAAFPTQNLPLDGPVTVRWNGFQVPYIEAESDADAAFVLGMVHAHLRLGQMEVAKRVAAGRLAEMGGPLLSDIDVALRTLGFGRAAEATLAAMPADSRLWLDRFVDGVNAYKASLPADRLPHEFRVLDLDPAEPWRAEDSIAVGRLAGVDINWLAWFALLPYADEPDFQALYAAARRLGRDGAASFAAADLVAEAAPADGAASPLARAARLAVLLGRTGSNSFAVAPDRSTTGAALIANDPHLGFNLPNIWFIAGLRSPSYQVVGMATPGVPVFGFGRTPTLAWGGTNLRSLNSDLVDVSDLPADRFRTETAELGVRFWHDETIDIRVSPYGPVITDAETVPSINGRDVALRWIGHQPSDEISALLAAARADTVPAFRDAMAGFGVPAQNFIVADTAGNIGHVVATRLPRRSADELDRLLTTPDRADETWADLADAGDLPFVLNPAAGYVASANNRPGPSTVPIGTYFPTDERIRRLAHLLGGSAPVGLDDLAAWQQDVYSPLGVELRDAVLARLDRTPAAADTPDRRRARVVLSAWDGRYEASSREALAFEHFLVAYTETLAEGLGRQRDFTVFGDLGFSRTITLRLTPTAEEMAWRRAVRAGLDAAVAAHDGGGVWGDIHRLTLQHFVLGRVPVLGERYRVVDIPIDGSRQTLYKTSHDLTTERHSAPFGSQSRHLSDLGDPDANYFVLLGGQDGWLNSDNFTDQLALWLDGDFVQMPLTPAAVAVAFPRVMTLQPR